MSNVKTWHLFPPYGGYGGRFFLTEEELRVKLPVDSYTRLIGVQMKKLFISLGEDSRIKVVFPYDPGLVEKIRMIEGRIWHPDGRYWSIPHSELKSLLSAFDGEKAEVDPSVWLYELEKELIARKYSRRTVKLYLHYNEELLKFSRKTPYRGADERGFSL